MTLVSSCMLCTVLRAMSADKTFTLCIALFTIMCCFYAHSTPSMSHSLNHILDMFSQNPFYNIFHMYGFKHFDV